jgi:site-specific DNA-methyltransferase (adenine-specific)
MRTDILFSSKEEKWETPQTFYDELDSEFHFTLDPAASEDNHKCKLYFTEEDDGLKKSWAGNTVFCNPPYCRKTGEWVKKAYNESLQADTKVVMLLPSRTDTKWFHEYCLPYGEIRFIKGRLKFGKAKNSAPFASMVVIFKGG